MSVRPDFHLLGVDRDVGRLPVDQGQRHHQHHRDQDQQREQQEDPVVGQRGQGERVAARVAVEQVPVDEEDDDDRADDALELRALALTEDVGAALLQEHANLRSRAVASAGSLFDTGGSSRSRGLGSARGDSSEGTTLRRRASPGHRPSAQKAPIERSWQRAGVARRQAVTVQLVARKKHPPISDDDRAVIGALLREVRRAAGYRSAETAAGAPGCPASRQTIYAYERGGLVPSLVQFLELSEFYVLGRLSVAGDGGKPRPTCVPSAWPR